jgi:hypothetical protein
MRNKPYIDTIVQYTIHVAQSVTGWKAGVQFLARAKDLSVIHNFQTGFVSNGYWRLFPGDNVAGA